MPLFIHKLIDGIKQAHGHSIDVRVTPHATDKETSEHLAAVLEGLETAECFDFGTLHLEPDGEGSGRYKLPAITDSEFEAFREKLIPLPAPVCWFEFTLGTTRSGLLVVETPDSNKEQHLWSVMQLDLIPGKGNDIFPHVNINGIWISIDLDRPGTHDSFNLIAHGNKWARAQVGEKFIQDEHAYQIPLTMYLALMLLSRTTELVSEPAPVKLNKQRLKNGRAPLPSHRVVRIIPEAYIREQRKAQGLSGRLPPRMHWRRSHLRTVLHQTPKAKQTSDGAWKILIPRMLIAKASDAEVSHEYRVG